MMLTRFVCARSLIFLVLLFGLGLGCLSLSQASAYGNCPPEMNSQAGSFLVDARGDWPSLFKHQRVFASCDDGELGEGYSEAVANLFAQGWDQFDTFAALAKTHPDFQNWAMRHIDATVSDDDLNRIILNSNTCINNAPVEKLCRVIRQSAENALMESARMRR
ncbi:hypothetical protein ACCC96_12515 [Pseudomonas sp. Pseusp11]|uniref:hypothetical protein n=1 Tax=Pseudomonas sp. Pseusp11 TaxID=3243003 RepID=UPI0039B3B0EE